jgi:hypothetical protein
MPKTRQTTCLGHFPASVVFIAVSLFAICPVSHVVLSRRRVDVDSSYCVVRRTSPSCRSSLVLCRSSFVACRSES